MRGTCDMIAFTTCGIYAEFFLENNFDLFEPSEMASSVLPPYPPVSTAPLHELASDHSVDYVFDSFIDTLYHQYDVLCSSGNIMSPNCAVCDFESIHQYVFNKQLPLLAVNDV